MTSSEFLASPLYAVVILDSIPSSLEDELTAKPLARKTNISANNIMNISDLDMSFMLILFIGNTSPFLLSGSLHDQNSP